MTNEELIAKIKEEIERRIKKYRDDGFGCHANSLEKFLPFFDTLESEKPMEQNAELNEEIKKEMVKLPFFVRGKDQIAFARHFAQWGAEHAREQMKEAVEGKIIFLLNGDVAVNIGDTDKYNLGQKIRVIVLPKED